MVLQALEPAFQSELSLRFPLDNISLLKGSQDLAAVLSDESLVRELFPDDLFFAGLDLLEPTVENIPVMMAFNRHYALANERPSFSSIQFIQAPLGLALRMKVVGQHLTSADVMTHILTYLPLIVKYYKEGKVAFGVSVPEKALADQVQEQCKTILPFHDDKYPIEMEGVLEVRYVPLDEL